MKKPGKRTAKQPKKAATKDLTAKDASTVKGGVTSASFIKIKIDPTTGQVEA